MEFIGSLYAIALPTHIIAATTTIGLVIASDLYGSLWILGKKETLNHTILSYLHWAVWIGLAITIFAGIFLFIPYNTYLLTLFAFRLKMLFVVFLVLNSFVITAHMPLATAGPFRNLSRYEKVKLAASGLVSTVGWIGAYTTAQFIGL